MVLIPGNHDQVTLGGYSHGLTALENSYRIETSQGGTVPGPLVLSYPTKFRNALFVPHIRDIATMESILQSTLAQEVSSLFVHADVTGAMMNDLIVSQDGVPPSSFPANKRIYSGHFHKPHTVQSGNVKIEYLGSPYETSLSEAQQIKSLAILDNSWQCLEYVPLDIGRKHFKVSNWHDLLQLHGPSQGAPYGSRALIKSGDRIVVTVSKSDLDTIQPAISSHIKMLRQAGATVEIREVKNVPTDLMGIGGVDHASILEEMTPESTWRAFIAEAATREAITDDSAGTMLTAGLELLEEMEAEDFQKDRGANLSDLQLTSVTVEGFGPFHDPTTYPLLGRGLVLLRGTNNDGGSDR
jgi:DNA repair exonuclease SbcCD nuclease subunit